MKTLHIQWITMLALVFMLTGCPFNKDRNTNNSPTPAINVPNKQELALEKIEAFATSNGSSTVPSLHDYIDAGVTGLDADELADLNEVVENLTATEVDTTSEIQALADALGINVDITAPVFSSSNTVSVNENQTSALTLVATDNSTVTYSISGTDASSFSVDSSTGVVTFNAAPDFETKTTYLFTAIAMDVATNATNQAVTITILDVDESTPTSIMHNGVGYNTITSPHTGKVWLDRNLGATQVCATAGSKNTSCFGGYYQWGRSTDGHENPLSETKDTRIVTGTKFVIGFSDWTEVDTLGNGRKLIWSKTDGSSVCPVDYRVPTSPEFIAEDSLNFLDLPASGRRYTTGLYQPDVGDTNQYGHLWTNSPRGDGSNAHYVIHKPSFFNTITHGLRSFGYNVRCIKD